MTIRRMTTKKQGAPPSARRGASRLPRVGALVLVAGVGAATGFTAAKRLGAHGGGGRKTERIVHIARIRAGNEADVRRLVEEQFPAAALAGTSIREVTTFIGSGQLVTTYAFDGEFTPTFAAVREHPAMTAYLTELGRHLDDAPAPQVDAPAAQRLASQAAHWTEAAGATYTPRVRPKHGSTGGA